MEVPVASTSVTAPAVPSATPSSTTPAAPEVEAPIVTGTPAASLRARPTWGKLEFISPYAASTEQYAPQLREPLETYLVATPLSGDVDRGFVICRYQSFGHSDALMGDDLHARLTLGNTPEAANDGPEDANLAFVSAPLASLKSGQTAKFDVYDRDVFELETITHATQKYAGAGLSVTDSGANIECRSLVGDAFKRTVTTFTKTADAAIATLSKKSIDVRETRSWGWPMMDIVAAQAATGDVAALTGWDEPRVVDEVGKIDNATAKLDADRTALFDSLYKASTDDGDAAGLHVHLVELACGAKKLAVGGAVAADPQPCVVHLQLRNDTHAALTLHDDFGSLAHVVTAQGPSRSQLFDAAGAEVDDLSLSPSSPVDVYIDGSIGGRATLANVCVQTSCAWVKVK